MLNSEADKIKAGDLKVFESVFKKYYESLCNFAVSYLKDMDLAEEIVQEVFYKIWKNHTKLDIKISLKAYLLQATKNQCYQFFKHRNVENKYAETVKLYGTKECIETTNQVEVEEISQTIDKTLDAMPEKCRQIFKMNRFEGLKYQEIADRLSISIKTVEANMGKALKLFRENLKHYVTCLLL